MPGEVQVSLVTSGVPIAVDPIVITGTTYNYQYAKLADGTPGGTSFIPGDSVAGLWVNVKAAVQQQISGTVQVSGPVQVSGAVSISGTVPVNLGTAVFIGSTTAVSGVSGPQIWLGASQSVVVNTIAAGFSVTVSGMVVTNTGVQSVNLGTAVFVGSTTAVSGVSGPQVWLGASQTVIVNTLAAGFSVTISGMVVTITGLQSVNLSTVGWVGSTTAVSGVSGPQVWLGASQSVIVNTIAAGFSVTISGMVVTNTGVQSVNLGTAVFIGSTTAVSGASGPQVWLGASQTINATVNTIAAGFSVTVSGQVVTNTGVQSVNLGTAVFVGSTTAVSGISGPQVWLGASQSVLIGGVWGTVIATTTAVSGSTGQLVWLGASQTIAVSILNQTNVDVTTATPGATATGLVVWQANPNSVSVSVSVSVVFTGKAIAFYYSSVSMATVLTQPVVTIALDGTTVATSLFVVPANKVLRIYGINLYVQNTAASVGWANGQVWIIASTSVSVTVGPVYAYVGAVAQSSATNVAGAGQAYGGAMEISAGFTVQVNHKMTGLTGAIMAYAIMGDIF